MSKNDAVERAVEFANGLKSMRDSGFALQDCDHHTIALYEALQTSRPDADYDETLHKIVMKHCSNVLSMEECRNLEIEIIRAALQSGDKGREADFTRIGEQWCIHAYGHDKDKYSLPYADFSLLSWLRDAGYLRTEASVTGLPSNPSDKILDEMCRGFHEEWDEQLRFAEGNIQWGFTVDQKKRRKEEMQKVYAAIQGYLKTVLPAPATSEGV